MAVNIGPRIGIEGEAEYRKQINNITQAQKTLTAEMKQTESAFDKNASAQTKNAAKSKILQQQVDKQKQKVEQLRHMTEQSTQKTGENSTATLKWKEALANAETELNRLNAELEKTQTNKFADALEASGQKLQSIGSKMSSVGDTLTTHVTAPLVAIGAASVAAYNEVDEAMDTIVEKTGASGDALEDMQDSAKSIAKRIPTSFQKAADAVGEVNTRFGETGESLEDLSEYFVEFAELNDTDVSDSVDGVQKAMKAFGVEAKDAKKVLDVMNGTGQRTGVSMSALWSSMTKNSAALQEMGLDIYSATSFLGDLEVSGADSTVVMQGLKTALKNAAEEGKTLPEALSEFQTVMNSSASDTDKLNAAIELFGSKAGPAIYEACKTGSLSFESLSNDATKYFGNVESTYEGTLGPESKLVTTMNSLKDTGAQVGETLLTVLEPAVSSVGEYISKLGDWYSSLDSETQEAVSTVALATAAGGPILSGLGRVVTSLGKIVTEAGKVTKALGGVSGLASVAGPLALAAGSAMLVKYAIESSANAHIAGYDEIKQKIADIGTATDTTKGELDDFHTRMSTLMDGVEIQTQPVTDLQTQLHSCFDENGKLKQGMEETAETIMGQLNEALGTDLSTDFTEDMDLNLQKLQEVDGAVQNYVETMKQAAIAQAFNEEYAGAVQRQADATIQNAQAEQTYYDALSGVVETQTRMNELAHDMEGVNWDAPGEAAVNAKAEYDELAITLRDQKDFLTDVEGKYLDSGVAAAQAASDVATLEEAMRLLGSASEEDRQKGVELFAQMQQKAEEAAKAVEKEMGGALDEVQEKVEDLNNEGLEIETEVEFLGEEKEAKNAKKAMEKILSTITGKVSNIESKSAASVARSAILTALSGLHPTLGAISGVAGATSTARALIEGGLASIRAIVNRIDVNGAMQSAWNALQSFFNNNPITAIVQTVTRGASSTLSNIASSFNVWGWANGGIVNEPTFGVFGEAGPEAFIPLSSNKRGRALDLYRQVGNIIGVGSGDRNTTNTTNVGGININVYAQPGQNVNDIAEAVSRKINNQVYRRGAVFA